MNEFCKEYKTGLTVAMPENPASADLLWNKIKEVLERAVTEHPGFTWDHTKRAPGENAAVYLYCCESDFTKESARELQDGISREIARFCRIERGVNSTINSGSARTN